MLGIVVVPRNSIEVQESEKGISILLEALLALQGCVAMVVPFHDLSVEPFNINLVLSQEVALQSLSVNCIHNALQKATKTGYDKPHLFVVRVSHECVIKVAHQVDEAFLLRTLD